MPEKVICKICKEAGLPVRKYTFKDIRGYNGHMQWKHKMPVSGAGVEKFSEEEKSDKQELTKIEQEIASKEKFDPEEIDQLKERLEPLKQKTDLRNQVSLAKLEAEKKEFDLRKAEADSKLKEFEDINPNSVSVKDLIELEKIRALRGNNNQSNNPENSIISNIVTAQMKTQSELQNQITSLLNERINSLEEAKDTQDIDKLQTNLEGIKKIGDMLGDKSIGTSVIDQVGGIIKTYKPILEEFMKKKQESSTEKITNLPRQPAVMPEHVPDQQTEFGSNVDNKLFSQSEEAGAAPAALPAPAEPASNPGPGPGARLPPEPSDQELLQMNYLHDSNYPSLEADNDTLSQYLGKGRFKDIPPITSTAPIQ